MGSFSCDEVDRLVHIYIWHKDDEIILISENSIEYEPIKPSGGELHGHALHSQPQPHAYVHRDQ